MKIPHTRSTITLNILTGPYTTEERQILLIKFDQKAYDDFLRSCGYIFAADEMNTEARVLKEIYLYIYKLLVIYSCPGQYVAFDVLLHNYILASSQSQNKANMCCYSQVIIHEGDNGATQIYSVLRHSTVSFYKNRYDMMPLLSRWLEDEKTLLMLRHVVNAIKNSPRRSVTYGAKSVAPWSWELCGDDAPGSVIVLSSEEP